MKKALITLSLISGILGLNAQIFTAKDGATNIRFFSESPLENIEAVNKGANIVFRSSTGDLQASISIQNFKFKNALMEEHFNENYMETEKYPQCVFKGKINETIDYTKEGENKVTVTGKLDLHGVIKDVTLTGTITGIKNKDVMEFKLNCKFKIRVADHNIKVPSMYVKNIAEVVDVTFESTLAPFVKK